MNIFVSRPTRLGPDFEKPYETFDSFLVAEGFTLKRLGGSNYSKKAPLRAVIDLVEQCCGAVILGYPQLELRQETRRSSTIDSQLNYIFPTPWNQIEGALAYAKGTPVMVVAHTGISGGVFDHGITGEAVIHLDLSDAEWFRDPRFAQPYAEWRSEVAICSARQPA